MEHKFYFISRTDSTDEYDTCDYVCVVHDAPEHLREWQDALNQVAVQRANNKNVFKLTLYTSATSFIKSDELVEFLDGCDHNLISIYDIELDKLMEDSSLRGHMVNIYYDGTVSFECYNKYSNVEYQTPAFRLQDFAHANG